VLSARKALRQKKELSVDHEMQYGITPVEKLTLGLLD
jgi:hypothetical protein